MTLAEVVDADPGMVGRAARAVPGRVLRASLPRLPLRSGAYASTIANFVVNHVADPRAAVRELARVTRVGGRVAITSWTSAPPGWGELVDGAFTAAGGAVAPPATRLPESLDFERSVTGLAGLAEQAGLAPVEATEVRWTWEVDAASLWRGVAGAAHFREAAADRTVDGVLRLPAVAAYVLAER